MKVILFEPSK